MKNTQKKIGDKIPVSICIVQLIVSFSFMGPQHLFLTQSDIFTNRRIHKKEALARKKKNKKTGWAP